MKIRGLPDGVRFDKYYTMNMDWMINGHYTFDGFTITYIMYDSQSDVWRMELRTNPGGYYAVTEAGQEKDYPFGTRTWNITSQYFNGSVALNLNGCDDFHQYNCRDGSCIPIEERHEVKVVNMSGFSVSYFVRCNGNNDCVDASDEVHCDKISVLDTYLNEAPAPPVDKEELTDVTLNVDIIQARIQVMCDMLFL